MHRQAEISVSYFSATNVPQSGSKENQAWSQTSRRWSIYIVPVGLTWPANDMFGFWRENPCTKVKVTGQSQGKVKYKVERVFVKMLIFLWTSESKKNICILSTIDRLCLVLEGNSFFLKTRLISYATFLSASSSSIPRMYCTLHCYIWSKPNSSPTVPL